MSGWGDRTYDVHFNEANARRIAEQARIKRPGRLVRWLARWAERRGLYEPNPPEAWTELSWLDREDGL